MPISIGGIQEKNNSIITIDANSGLFPPHTPVLSIALRDELGDLKGPIGCFSGGYRWHD